MSRQYRVPTHTSVTTQCISYQLQHHLFPFWFWVFFLFPLVSLVTGSLILFSKRGIVCPFSCFPTLCFIYFCSDICYLLPSAKFVFTNVIVFGLFYSYFFPSHADFLCKLMGSKAVCFASLPFIFCFWCIVFLCSYHEAYINLQI